VDATGPLKSEIESEIDEFLHTGPRRLAVGEARDVTGRSERLGMGLTAEAEARELETNGLVSNYREKTIYTIHPKSPSRSSGEHVQKLKRLNIAKTGR
jgi:hypothetical protein